MFYGQRCAPGKFNVYLYTEARLIILFLFVFSNPDPYLTAQLPHNRLHTMKSQQVDLIVKSEDYTQYSMASSSILMRETAWKCLAIFILPTFSHSLSFQANTSSLCPLLPGVPKKTVPKIEVFYKKSRSGIISKPYCPNTLGSSDMIL